MRNDKHLATQLRRAGKSYKKISTELGIPKSTVSDWFKGAKWSVAIREELTRKANYISKKRLLAVNKKRSAMWKAWREEARSEARKDFEALAQNPLFVAGIMLYWGEGDSKPANPLRLSNSDPRMISVYVEFLKDILRIPAEKIRIGLILYPDLSDESCRAFWAKTARLRQGNFVKTQVIYGRHPTKRLEHGVCMVVVGSRQYKIKVLEWIDLFYRKNIMV